LRISSFFASKKYFQRVLFTIMVAMALILSSLAVVNTIILERSVKHVQEDANLKVLTQIQYNMAYMTEIMTHLSSFAYRDNYIIPLMFSDPLPEMDYIRGYNEMARLMQSSSFLDSVAVYNAANGELFSTAREFTVDGGVTKRRMLDWLVRSSEPHPPSRLIPVNVGPDRNRYDAFAFIVSDAYMPFDGSRSAVVLYIKSDWVFESLRRINGAGKAGHGEIYIQTPDGRLLAGTQAAAPAAQPNPAVLQQLMEKDRSASGRTSGFAIGDAGGGRSMITYMKGEGAGDWTILYVQPYSLVMKEVNDIRTKSLLVTAVFLGVAVAVSIWLSYSLYGPIENMLRKLGPVARGSRAEAAAGNELELVSENVRQMSDKLREISSEQIVRKYYLRKFLTDGGSISEDDMKLIIERNGLRLRPGGPMLVCVLRIDGLAAYERGTSGASKQLYGFAIVNIALEIVSRSFLCEAVDIQSGHVALILSSGEEETAFNGVAPLIRTIQDTISRYYGLSLSCGISGAIRKLPQLQSACHQALQLSCYSYAKGRGSVITEEDVRGNLANGMTKLPEEIERKLSEALRKGKLTNAGSELEQAFALLAAFAYDDMRRAVSDLVWVVKNTAVDILSNRVAPLSVEPEQILRIPEEQETLDDIHLALLSVCAAICEGQRPAAFERNEWIVGTIKELIAQKFQDINLCQQSIAATVKLTSAYTGKLFKDSCGVSITEYINDVRLQHAELLLLRTDDTIAEIMEKSGYFNQSYFFRLFKGKFGCTPKDYRLKKSIS